MCDSCDGINVNTYLADQWVRQVAHTDGDRVIELNAPEDLYDIAALRRDNQRFVVEAISSRMDGEQAAAGG